MSGEGCGVEGGVCWVKDVGSRVYLEDRGRQKRTAPRGCEARFRVRRVLGSGRRVQGSGFRILDAGIRVVSGAVCQVQGRGYTAECLRKLENMSELVSLAW